MNIPDEAVEAAARVIYRTSGAYKRANYETARTSCTREAKKVLEAAAPMIAFAAWEQGAKAQANAYGMDVDTGANPYKQEISPREQRN